MIYANSTCISLSPYQRDIWVAAMQFPDTNQYTILSYIQFSNNIDESTLKVVLINTAEKTDVFRLRLSEEDGIPYQWIDKEFEHQVTLIDLTHQTDSTASAESWLQDAFNHSHKLDASSLVDFTLLRTTESVYVHVRTHHIVSDAWGLQIFMNQVRTEYPINQRDVLLQKTPASFDVSVWELSWWSFTGASLSLLPPSAEKDPREVLRAIERDSVTVIHFVPSMLSPLLDLLESDLRLRDSAASLRLVFCSGEALIPAQVIRFKRIFSNAVQLVNLYGPTEAAIDVSDFECPNDLHSRVPIGKPIDNIQLYVLNKELKPQPLGAAGELYIGGVGLARGYPLNAIQQAHGDTLHTAFNYVNLHVLEPLKELSALDVWEQFYAGWAEEVQVVIAATPEAGISSTPAQDRPFLENWGDGPVTFLGDAAHPMLTSLGQGAALAIEGAAVLAHCLATIDDTKTALRTYENQRRDRARAMVEGARALSHIEQLENPFSTFVRNLYFRFVSELSLTKKNEMALLFFLESNNHD
ncbi:AMP-binding protein [Xenorhabdus miraniensis]|uniref:Putative non-ribosomal peptide synthase n=1 Tax=Xenorhabdus miraniensis TaxID=351674 RepID=A0A2D0JJD3_9GAMM|nr:AMP-binding protein [Xenorhabdus miraniensis]PHM45541.1 putative non-ribosomal peptide synthase [Xenorhabdus miraniensis]